MPQLIVLEPTDDRKQQWRVARPCRTGLPQQLKPFSISERAQFSAIALIVAVIALLRSVCLSVLNGSPTVTRHNS